MENKQALFGVEGFVGFEREVLEPQRRHRADMEAKAATAPDLRTVEGQLQFLDYHPPDEDQIARHNVVNVATQQCWRAVQYFIPDGPGKTVALRALNDARMAMNSAIANYGA